MNNKEVWLAFTTLSDAQTLLQEFNDIDRANDEINHAKIHLGKLMESWSTQERTDAMTVNRFHLQSLTFNLFSTQDFSSPISS